MQLIYNWFVINITWKCNYFVILIVNTNINQKKMYI